MVASSAMAARLTGSKPRKSRSLVAMALVSVVIGTNLQQFLVSQRKSCATDKPVARSGAGWGHDRVDAAQRVVELDHKLADDGAHAGYVARHCLHAPLQILGRARA